MFWIIGTAVWLGILGKAHSDGNHISLPDVIGSAVIAFVLCGIAEIVWSLL